MQEVKHATTHATHLSGSLAWLDPLVGDLLSVMCSHDSSENSECDECVVSKFSRRGYNIPKIPGLKSHLDRLYGLVEDRRALAVRDLHIGVQKAEEALNCVLEMLELLGSPCLLSERRRRCFLLTYGIGFGITGTAVKWLKCHFAALFSKATGQQLPPTPDDLPGKPGVLGGGKLYRLLNMLCLKKNNWAFRASILQAKKGMPKVPESFIKEGYRKHFKALSVSDSPELPDLHGDDLPSTEYVSNYIARMTEGGEFNPMRLISEVRRTVEELPFRPVKSLDFLVPSMSGHFENSGVKNGACSFLHPRFRDCIESEILRMYWNPRTNRCVSWYQPVLALDWLEHFKDEFEKETLDCRPVALAEPLKVRVITKGPSGPYYLCRYLQKAIHGQLRNMPGFELIGHPCSEDYLEKRLDRKSVV